MYITTRLVILKELPPRSTFFRRRVLRYRETATKHTRADKRAGKKTINGPREPGTLNTRDAFASGLLLYHLHRDYFSTFPKVTIRLDVRGHSFTDSNHSTTTYYIPFVFDRCNKFRRENWLLEKKPNRENIRIGRTPVLILCSINIQYAPPNETCDGVNRDF